MIYSSIVYLYDVAMVIACGKYVSQGYVSIDNNYLPHLLDDNDCGLDTDYISHEHLSRHWCSK